MEERNNNGNENGRDLEWYLKVRLGFGELQVREYLHREAVLAKYVCPMEILTCGDFEMDVEIWYKMKCTSCYSCMHFFTDGTGKPNCRLEKHDMPEFIKLHDEYYLKNSEKSIAKKILENILIETWNFSENDLKGFFKRLEWERKIIHPLDVKPCEDYIHDGFSTEFKGVFQCHSCLLMRWDDARNRMNCSIKARNRNRFESRCEAYLYERRRAWRIIDGRLDDKR